MYLGAQGECSSLYQKIPSPHAYSAWRNSVIWRGMKYTASINFFSYNRYSKDRTLVLKVVQLYRCP